MAIQPSHSLKEYILGEVISYSVQTGVYEIADADSTKRYTLPETQVIDLSSAESEKRFTKGEVVLAVYPGNIPLHMFFAVIFYLHVL